MIDINTPEERKNARCNKHGVQYWKKSTPPGRGYCHQCAKDLFSDPNWPRCPHCGERDGFAPGIGDCGCDISDGLG